jgi:hypothetical protein
MERGWVWLLEKASAPCASQATKPSLQLWHAEVASGQCKCLGTAKAQAKLLAVAAEKHRRWIGSNSGLDVGPCLVRGGLFVCVCVSQKPCVG